VDLVREVLDEQVVDRRNCPIGKADGIVLAVEPGRPPRVVAIEIGPVVAARRVHPKLAVWLQHAMRRLGVGGGEPLRVPIGQVHAEGINLKADVDAERTAAFAWERWLRDRVIGRIPGSGR
jgi:hypothetical protein